MTDGASLNWQELLQPVEPAPACACEVAASAPILASTAMGVAAATQIGLALQKWAV